MGIKVWGTLYMYVCGMYIVYMWVYVITYAEARYH